MRKVILKIIYVDSGGRLDQPRGVLFCRGFFNPGTLESDTSKTITSVLLFRSAGRSAISIASSSVAVVGPTPPSGRAGVGCASFPNQNTRYTPSPSAPGAAA